MQYKLLENFEIKQCLEFCVSELKDIMEIERHQVNIEQIEDLMKKSIEFDNYICLIAKEDDDIFGLFGFVISNKLGLYEKQCNDIIILTQQNHRSFKVVKTALEIITEYCKKEKVRYLTLGISLNYNMEGVKKLYERFGFKHSGYSLTKEL